MSISSFDPIISAYNFFRNHSSEAKQDVIAYARAVHFWGRLGHIQRILDFGCGDGIFGTEMLKMANASAQNLELTLVDVAKQSRKKARELYSKLKVKEVSDYSMIEDEQLEQHDLIFANHSLYFADDLAKDLNQLLDQLSPRGLFLATLAGTNNFLVQIWKEAFHSIAKQIPFYVAEDFEHLVAGRTGLSYSKTPINYIIKFPDTKENRLQLPRFLLSDYMKYISEKLLLSLFDPYSNGKEVLIFNQHYLYSVEWLS